MKGLNWIIILVLIAACKENDNSNSFDIAGDIELVSYFDNGDRIFLKIPTRNNDSLYVFTDTGGGFTAIFPNAVKRFGWEEFVVHEEFDGESGALIFANDIIEQNYYHPFLNQRIQKNIKMPFFFAAKEEDVLKNEMESIDGFFGQFFFLGRAWTFDYLNQKVTLHKELELNPNRENIQKIGLKKDKFGNFLFGHPSIVIKVDEEEIPVLFDTGATFSLSRAAQIELNAKEKIGGSFIANSVYEQWKTDHPEWKILKDGDLIEEGGQKYYFDMIEVPQINVGGNIVGPVWFSVRSDKSWSKYMIRTMDKIVKGAIGGSGLKYLKVNIDYNKELIGFSKNTTANN